MNKKEEKEVEEEQRKSTVRTAGGILLGSSIAFFLASILDYRGFGGYFLFAIFFPIAIAYLKIGGMRLKRKVGG